MISPKTRKMKGLTKTKESMKLSWMTKGLMMRQDGYWKIEMSCHLQMARRC